MVSYDLIKVFQNIKDINITITGSGESSKYMYPFSISSLLSMIENTEINKVTIRARKHNKTGYCCLSSIYSSSLSIDQIVNNKFKLELVGDKILKIMRF